MKKKQFYEKPSVEVVELKCPAALLTASLEDYNWHDEPEEASPMDYIDDFGLM